MYTMGPAFRGSSLASPLTPPSGSVVFLLHGNGTNGATTFYESAGNKTISTVGTATISNALSKFNGTSINMAVTSYISAPDSVDWKFGSGDFTVEIWFYTSVVPGPSAYQGLIAQRLSSGSQSWSLFLSGDYGGRVILEGFSGVTVQSANPVIAGKWNHAYVTRKGNIAQVALNGEFGPPSTVSGSLASITQVLSLGVLSTASGNYLAGNVAEARIVKGYSLGTKDFFVPTAPVMSSADPYYEKVALLLHGDGVNGSTAVVDSSPVPKAVTVNGGVVITTGTSKWAGGAIGPGSIFFDMLGGSNCTVANSSGFSVTGDFTVETWVNPTLNNANKYILRKGSGAFTDGFVFSINASGNIGFTVIGPSDESGNRCFGTSTIAINTWSHLAATKKGNVVRVFVNGVLETTITLVAAATDNTGLLYIGRDLTDNLKDFSGYLDDLRITSNVCRWTATFTPPRDMHPNYGNYDPFWASTVLSMNFAGSSGSTTMTDDTGRHTFTATGAAALSSVDFKYQPTSLALDGSSSYIACTDNLTDFVFTTADFTVECYFKTSASAGRVLLDYFNTGASSRDWQLWLNASSFIEFYAGGVSNGSVMVGSTALNDGAWHHVAVARVSGVMFLYVDGVQVATTSTVFNFGETVSRLSIGAQVTIRNAAYDFNGYMSGVRITSACRYPVPFTPLPAPWPNHA